MFFHRTRFQCEGTAKTATFETRLAAAGAKLFVAVGDHLLEAVRGKERGMGDGGGATERWLPSQCSVLLGRVEEVGLRTAT